MDFMAVRCGCGNVWAAEDRHRSVKCNRCGRRSATSSINIQWRGHSAQQAKIVVQQLRQKFMEERAPAWAALSSIAGERTASSAD